MLCLVVSVRPFIRPSLQLGSPQKTTFGYIADGPLHKGQARFEERTAHRQSRGHIRLRVEPLIAHLLEEHPDQDEL